MVTSVGGHMQMLDLSVSGARGDEPAVQPLALPDGLRTAPAGLEGPALNVAQAWLRFADDIRGGTRTCPDFDDAVTRHRMIDAIERSAASGRKESV